MFSIGGSGLQLVGGAAALVAALPWLRARAELSRAKHPSVAGHSRLAKRLAKVVPRLDYDDARFFCADGGVTQEVVERRRAGFAGLAETYRTRFPRSRACTAAAAQDISDLAFTAAYRVPFQFSRVVQEHLGAGAFVQSSAGVKVDDLDGNSFYDLTGSYGVNLFGYDFYKGCIERAQEQVRALGPVLGPYHPLTADNAARLKQISGLDEVSFHMSGTEAVMQAVRLARYHTRRSKLVRFCGAYHGWSSEVQPGIGNPETPSNTLTLQEGSQASLRVLARRRDIACVLVNPLQALHPNASPPADSMLVGAGRRAGVDRAGYAAWLARLRAVCDERGIPLILDEVFTGFRLARGGAQEYFGVRADLVTYGKTLGGGLPVGVVCGRRDLMKRFREDRPMDVCFARGTFHAHPYVMAAMDGFLRHIGKPEVAAAYADLDVTWDGRAAKLNERLADTGLPVRVANLSSIWTVLYQRSSRYNWMLQYYLRAEGLALSWVGTGRIIFSLDYTDTDFADVAECFVSAAKAMERDGWWAGPLLSERAIKRQIFREVLRQHFVAKAAA